MIPMPRECRTCQTWTMDTDDGHRMRLRFCNNPKSALYGCFTSACDLCGFYQERPYPFEDKGVLG